MCQEEGNKPSLTRTLIERVRQYYAEIEQLQKEIGEVKERLKATIKER